MNETELLLGELRDIHEPAAPAGVSLWLMAANLLVVLLILSALHARRRRHKERWRQQALHQIDRAQSLPTQTALLLLARTLRQVMLTRVGESNLQSGQSWLEQLDAEFCTDWFTHSDGQVFGPALYTRHALTTDTRTLCTTLQVLVRRLPSRSTTVQQPRSVDSVSVST